jgi:hypothetical protein
MIHHLDHDQPAHRLPQLFARGSNPFISVLPRLVHLRGPP